MLDKEILSVRELATFLDISEGAVRNMVCKCQLPYYKPFGKVYFKKEEIMKIVQEARVSSVDELIQARS
ncbi:MAG: helix-turn-helix domain-containing protein [Prevotella sp.]|nr:helix-turn-helix domain-containing protein [Prevotella sp.]